MRKILFATAAVATLAATGVTMNLAQAAATGPSSGIRAAIRSGMPARDFACIDQCSNLIPQVWPPVEIVLPKHARHARMGEKLRVGLLDLPVIGEWIHFMILLGRAVLIGPIAKVVVL